MIRPTWDEYFLAVCDTIKLRSDCRRKKVGSLIVNSDNRIIATGYNGALPGHPSCGDGACPRGQRTYQEVLAFSDYGNCISVHAEINALRQLQGSGLTCRPRECTLYVSYKPCEWCEEAILASGIRRIAWPDGVSELQVEECGLPD